jgi:TRAP-type C4-dicarboxylate transport system permease small subunit
MVGDQAYGVVERSLRLIALFCAYLGGAVISAVALMSVASIVGRTVIGRTVAGDFELVEIGIAVAASMFLPHCQATRAHIVVDFFTLKAGARAIARFDRLGHLLMAVMLLVIAWRTSAAAVDLWASGQTSMLRGFPLWLGYAATVPGVLVAGLIALVQVIAPRDWESSVREQG